MDFADIYEKYSREIYRFALYLSGNRALAEDLTAETFVNAFCGRAEIRVGTVKAYLIAITRNLYRDSIAFHRRLVPIDEVAEQVDPSPLPDRAAAQSRTFSRMLRAVRKLPEAQRDALILAVDHELGYEQIAAILGCSVAAVKVRIHRARLQLRLELMEEEPTWKT